MICEVSNEYNTKCISFCYFFSLLMQEVIILRDNTFIVQIGILVVCKLESYIVLISEIQNC